MEIFCLQGGKASFGRNRDNDETSQSALMETPVSSNSLSNPNQMRSQTTDAESLGSALASEYEDAESGMQLTLSLPLCFASSLAEQGHKT